ncbi:hypothetical protein K5D65_13455 [Pseudomonas cichorii]|nr:hypothetical protein [Pseudomonas cichorii]
MKEREAFDVPSERVFDSVKGPGTVRAMSEKINSSLTSVAYSSYIIKFQKSHYDQAALEELEIVKKINDTIDKYKAKVKRIGSASDDTELVGFFSDQKLESIRKETYLLAPFIESKKIGVGIRSDLDGLYINLQNSTNSLSVISSGDRKLVFSYVVKKGKGNSMSIDGFIDLNDNDDNINYVGLKKILSIYSGE